MTTKAAPKGQGGPETARRAEEKDGQETGDAGENAGQETLRGRFRFRPRRLPVHNGRTHGNRRR